MPKNITHEADMALFPMTSCIVGTSERDGYVREIVSARKIIDVSDMFTKLGPTGTERVLIKFGFTALGPVCEMLEQAASDTDGAPSGPGVFIQASSDSFVTMYRLQSSALAEIGLARLDNANPDELSAEDSLLTSQVRRMGGNPVEVAHFIFNNIPDDSMTWLDQ